MPPTMLSKLVKVKSSKYPVQTILTERIWKQMIIKALCEQLNIDYHTIDKAVIEIFAQEGEVCLEIKIQ